ncbi:hypothetical protein KAURM247S_08242 [Kitasatospora aureofaciens]
MQVGVQPDLDPVAALGGHRRPGPVGRQLQLLREPCQLLLPIVQLPGEQAVRVGGVAEQLALPKRVVGVLYRQRGPLRGLALAAGRVGCGQVAGERAHRPAVGGDVVHHDQQRVPAWGERVQLRPDRRFHRQVEAALGRLRQPLGQLVLVRLDHRQRRVRLRGAQHDLVRHAVGLSEDRPQALVPGHHVRERGVQGRAVEPTGQAQGKRHVVGGAGPFHPVQEPQSALGEGQRHLFGPGPGRQRGTRRSGAVQAGRQGSHGRGLEQRPDLQLRAEGRPGPGGQAGRQQGVPAQIEETVVDTDLRQAQHLGEQLGEELLLRGARRPPHRERAEVGGGQSTTVELAVGRQRQRLQRHERRGDEVVGQPVA